MSSTHPMAGTNLAVLVGTVRSDPELRTLPSGDEVLSLEVTVRPSGGPIEHVPIAWHRPPGWTLDLDPGEELVVVGRVQRRFFRVGGTTQSRTEVIASDVVLARKRAAAARAIAGAALQLDEPVGAPQAG